MIVGFMRNQRRPFFMARLLAKTSKYNGIDLVYFSPRDIDVKNKIINGKMLINDKWVSKKISPPLFIDVSPYSFKYRKAIKFLKENSTLSTDKLGSKETVYEKIREDGEYSHLLIPTGEYTNFEDFLKFLKENTQIVIKPKEGLRGKGIYMLTKNRYKFLLSYQQEEKKISKSELKDFYDRRLKSGDYILQKYVSSRTKSGDPFDCRIRLEKNGKGKWAVALYLIRIGSNQKVVSNVAQGGSVSALTPFLNANFNEHKTELKESIKNIAKTLPYRIEEIFDVNLSSLGLDIAIDQNGKLYLFEVENGPGFEFGTGEIASIKAEYYKYILKIHQEKANPKSLK